MPGKFSSIGASLDAGDIECLSYVDFIALLDETNRCPGGKDTVRDISLNTFISKDSEVLEVGSNTGFTSLELARTAKCRVIGIDPAESAVQMATRALSHDAPSIRELVQFRVGSAYELPFTEGRFDLLVAGGATGFMSEKARAISEYYRVLKPWGFLAIAQLYYATPPPGQLLSRISSLIGSSIEAWTSEEWLALFERHAPFERYMTKRRLLGAQPIERVDSYVDMFMGKPHIKALSEPVQIAIRNRWRETLLAFNENHQYVGYVVALYRKRTVPEEPELFTPDRALD